MRFLKRATDKAGHGGDFPGVCRHHRWLYGDSPVHFSLRRFELRADGVALSTQAFSSVFGKLGGVFVAVSIVMFAFATLVSWSYYGERSLEYPSGGKAGPGLPVPVRSLRSPGLRFEPDSVWKAADTFNGLMAIPNMIALVLLSREVFAEMSSHRLLKNGIKRRRENAPHPLKMNQN